MHTTWKVQERTTGLQMGVAGWATVQAAPPQIAALRKNPGLPDDKPLPAGFLKNADEQTVLALAALGRALKTLGRPVVSYENWGVIAAANLFGRAGMAQGLLNFRKDGAWGISPHLIPHHSLHAISGTISQALHIHGPNFGIGGGPNAVAEALLVAATLLSDDTLPGLWVVLSGHEPESIPTATGAGAQSTGLAAALALTPVGQKAGHRPVTVTVGVSSSVTEEREFCLADMVAALNDEIPSGHWTLPGGAWARLLAASEKEAA